MALTGKAGGGQVLCNSQVPSGLQMFAGVGTGRRISFIYLLYSPLISFIIGISPPELKFVIIINDIA